MDLVSRIGAVAVAALVPSWAVLAIMLGNAGLHAAIVADDVLAGLVAERPVAVIVSAVVAVGGGTSAAFQIRLRVGFRQAIVTALMLIAGCLAGAIAAILLVGELTLADLPRILLVLSVGGLTIVGGTIGTWLGGRLRR